MSDICRGQCHQEKVQIEPKIVHLHLAWGKIEPKLVSGGEKKEAFYV